MKILVYLIFLLTVNIKSAELKYVFMVTMIFWSFSKFLKVEVI